MNWIPPIFDPLSPYMVALVILWYVALTLALHRLTRTIQWKRFNRRWRQAIETMSASRSIKNLPVPIDGLMCVLRSDSSDMGLERFHRETLGSDQAVDRTNDRWLKVIIAVAPLIGLVGTADGLLHGFRDIAAVLETPTLRDLATPIGSALMTTIHGALCTVFCVICRSSWAVTEHHHQTNRSVAVAWETLARKVKTQKDRKKAENAARADDGKSTKGPTTEGNNEVRS